MVRQPEAVGTTLARCVGFEVAQLQNASARDTIIGVSGVESDGYFARCDTMLDAVEAQKFRQGDSRRVSRPRRGRETKSLPELAHFVAQGDVRSLVVRGRETGAQQVSPR